MNWDYGLFATAFSALAILSVSAAGLISRRRAQRPEFRDIEYHQVRPLLLVVLVIAVATLPPALTSGGSLWIDAAHWSGSFIRGVCLGVGLMFVARYWFVRGDVAPVSRIIDPREQHANRARVMAEHAVRVANRDAQVRAWEAAERKRGAPRKTHCLRGHALTDDGRRYGCRECRNERRRAQRAQAATA